MFRTAGFKALFAIVATAVALSAARGSAGAAGYNAGLLRCSLVSQPAAITGCGTDPLKGGRVSINNVGDVTVDIDGALTNTTYSVAFVAFDGSASTPLGTAMTNARGNATLRKPQFFPFGTVGAGNVVVSNGGTVEFVSGAAISTDELPSGPSFAPSLVRCADVTVPAKIASCGTDPLKNGSADLEEDSADLTIRISGAAAKTIYTATLLAQNGASATLGSLAATNMQGNGAFLVIHPAFSGGVGVSGTFVISKAGTREYLSGFKVTSHPSSPDVSHANLVRCADVTIPVLAAASCGTDPLDHGNYEVDANGKLSVSLHGAAPRTNYEVFFRPLNNSGDQDTALLVATGDDGNGNAHAAVAFLTSGSVAAGTFVVKHQTGTNPPDQFVAGFKIH